MLPNVRTAERADITTMLAVWHAADLLTDAEQRRVELERAFAVAAELLLVAEVDGSVCGVLLCTTDGHRGYLKRLVVSPERRRRGVGRALVAEAERRFARRSLTRLNLTVRVDAGPARAFWAALGYRLEPAVLTWVKDAAEF